MNTKLNTKNYQSMSDYIDNLFSRYARLLVIRLDLGYRKDVDTPYMTPNEIYAAYQQAKQDKEHLFNNMRSNQIFDYMVGFIWRLEYGEEKGFHYHCIFFFDGSKVQQDINIATMIGEYWANTITQGRGLYYNCNLHKKQYKLCGIGMINYDQADLVKNLKSTSKYLAKPDNNLSLFINDLDIGRTFGRGVMKERTETRGRPRLLNQVALPMQNVF